MTPASGHASEARPDRSSAQPGASAADERTGAQHNAPVGGLACGADIDELLEQVAGGLTTQLTTHQQGCGHCSAALTELTELWEPVAASTAIPVIVPDGFADSVMTRVRASAANTWYTLELTDGGSIRVAARIVARLARGAAQAVPGVRVALGRSTSAKLAHAVERATLGHLHPNSAVGVLGRTAVVDLALAISYGEPAHDVARRVQSAVAAELRQRVGLKNVTVNVVVDDIVDPR